MDCALDITKEIVMKFDYSIKNQLLRSIAIGSFILSIFAGNIFASSTELYWTLKENDVWEAKNLLDQGANLFEPVGPLGETPLDIAAPWTIRSLFTEERYKHYSHEALYWTVKHKTVPKAQQFLDLGADPNTSGPYGITPMQMASSQEMLEALLECGGNPHVALGTAIRHLYVDIVRQLVVERGIAPHAIAIDLAIQI
jgi:hypothetical protein